MQRFLSFDSFGRALTLAAPLLMTAALTTLATTLLSAPAQAQSTPPTQYNFTRIVDNAGPFASFTTQVSLSNNGTVAFVANLDGGGLGIFTGSGGQTTTIAATTAAGGQFRSLETVPTLNNAGAVAFTGSLSSAGFGVFVSSGGRLTTLAASGAGSPFLGLGNRPAINEHGQVALQGSAVGGSSGIYVVDGSGGGQATTIAIGQSLGYPILSAELGFNNRGAVAFTGVRGESSPTALFLSNGGPLVRLADNTGPLRYFGAPALNDAGVVAFQAELNPGGSGNNGLFTILNGQLTTLGDATSPLVRFSDPALNNEGRVAFRALVRGGGNASAALFTAAALPVGVPDLLAGRVIGVGDVLDGSTITSVGSSRSGFNDQGQLAFFAVLADGRRGIYRADPGAAAEVIPEPGTLVLLTMGAGLGGLLAVRWRRRQS